MLQGQGNHVEAVQDRGDMIIMFRIMTGKDKVDPGQWFRMQGARDGAASTRQNMNGGKTSEEQLGAEKEPVQPEGCGCLEPAPRLGQAGNYCQDIQEQPGQTLVPQVEVFFPDCVATWIISGDIRYIRFMYYYTLGIIDD